MMPRAYKPQKKCYWCGEPTFGRIMCPACLRMERSIWQKRFILASRQLLCFRSLSGDINLVRRRLVYLWRFLVHYPILCVVTLVFGLRTDISYHVNRAISAPTPEPEADLEKECGAY